VFLVRIVKAAGAARRVSIAELFQSGFRKFPRYDPRPCQPKRAPKILHVLIIEDDPMIAEGLVRILQDEGMQADWVCDGPSGQRALESGAYGVALLDIGLPGKSGFDVLRFIRKQGNDIPLLILSARDAEDDRVRGLKTGADDYLVKPFGAKELIARIRAVLRRQRGGEIRVIGNGEITLDLASHELCYQGTRRVLSANEFRLMSALLQNPGVILSRSQIEERVYHRGHQVESNAIEVLIHGLRKKFDKQIVRNVRGIGWMVLNATR
jgi:two-component system OmpR family response regulator